MKAVPPLAEPGVHAPELGNEHQLKPSSQPLEQQTELPEPLPPEPSCEGVFVKVWGWRGRKEAGGSSGHIPEGLGCSQPLRWQQGQCVPTLCLKLPE